MDHEESGRLMAEMVPLIEEVRIAKEELEPKRQELADAGEIYKQIKEAFDVESAALRQAQANFDRQLETLPASLRIVFSSQNDQREKRERKPQMNNEERVCWIIDSLQDTNNLRENVKVLQNKWEATGRSWGNMGTLLDVHPRFQVTQVSGDQTGKRVHSKHKEVRLLPA